MCNLYTVRKSAAEVAAHFSVDAPTEFNTPEETLPGYPGMVVREAEGARVLQSMVWGFPHTNVYPCDTVILCQAKTLASVSVLRRSTIR